MDRKPTKVDLKELREDAPLTTRMNVPFYERESIGNGDAAYRGGFDCIEVLPIYVDGITSTLTFDEDGFPEENFEHSIPEYVTAHELTHAYNGRFKKELRGWFSILDKSKQNKEMGDKLKQVSEELFRISHPKLYLEGTELMYKIEEIDEAIAYAVGAIYDGPLPTENPVLTKTDPNSERFKSALGACQRLIKFVGIDGSRAFVRRKMREMYLSGAEGKTLEEEVDDFEKSVAGFFVSSDAQA